MSGRKQLHVLTKKDYHICLYNALWSFCDSTNNSPFVIFCQYNEFCYCVCKYHCMTMQKYKNTHLCKQVKLATQIYGNSIVCFRKNTVLNQISLLYEIHNFGLQFIYTWQFIFFWNPNNNKNKKQKQKHNRYPVLCRFDFFH